LRISGDPFPEALRYCSGDSCRSFAGLSSRKTAMRKVRATATMRVLSSMVCSWGGHYSDIFEVRDGKSK